MIQSMQKGLPGLGADEEALPREKRLLRWFKERGLDLTTDVALIMGGVHRTFPGKCLVACTDQLPREMRQKLLAYGVPESLLPPPPPEKKPFAPRSRGGNYCAF